MGKSLEEINAALLSKSLDEYYLVIIENRKVLLTDEEMNKILGYDYVIDGVSEEGKNFAEMLFASSDPASKIASKVLLSLADIRLCGIVTLVDGVLYNITTLNNRVIDLRTNKIIKYDKITKFWSDDVARLKLMTPQDGPDFFEDVVILDMDDEYEKAFYDYEKYCETIDESEDLTKEFIDEITNNGPRKTLKPNN